MTVQFFVWFAQLSAFAMDIFTFFALRVSIACSRQTLPRRAQGSRSYTLRMLLLCLLWLTP